MPTPTNRKWKNDVAPTKQDFWTQLDSVIAEIVAEKNDRETALGKAMEIIGKAVETGELEREPASELANVLQEIVRGGKEELPMAWKQFQREFREHLKDQN